MRVRIAQATSTSPTAQSPDKGYSGSFMDSPGGYRSSSSETLMASEIDDGLGPEERRVLDKIGETLARLGRNKRVGLGVKEKLGFVKTWSRSHKHF